MASRRANQALPRAARLRPSSPPTRSRKIDGGSNERERRSALADGGFQLNHAGAGRWFRWRGLSRRPRSRSTPHWAGAKPAIAERCAPRPAREGWVDRSKKAGRTFANSCQVASVRPGKLRPCRGDQNMNELESSKMCGCARAQTGEPSALAAMTRNPLSVLKTFWAFNCTRHRTLSLKILVV